MKPYVVCHMVASIDGRILHSRWRPTARDGGDLFERLHAKLGGDAWVVGRVIYPAVDGAKGAPSVFDSTDRDAELRAPVAQMSLESCEVLDGGAVWLRYRIRKDAAQAAGDPS